MSDLDSDDDYEPQKSKGKAAGPIERAAWTRVECFKVEKLLLIYGYILFCYWKPFFSLKKCDIIILYIFPFIAYYSRLDGIAGRRL